MGAGTRSGHQGGCESLAEAVSCLLYTSDAADERSSVDLGGRRIIKKKTDDERSGWSNNVRQTIEPSSMHT